jgi:hypothetical protein
MQSHRVAVRLHRAGHAANQLDGHGFLVSHVCAPAALS